MGLEIAEILMDIEDAYLINIEENDLDQWNGTVGDLCKLLFSAINQRAPAICPLYQSKDPFRKLNKSEFNQYAEKTPGLRTVRFLVPPHANTINKINGFITMRNKGLGTLENVQFGICRIIQMRLGLPELPALSDHLVKDLGCG